jgi:rhodanese-related sulfurtransferase
MMVKYLFLICCSWLMLAPGLVFAQSPAPAYQTISPAAFQQQLKSPKALLLDVRTAEEFARGHLAGALNLNFYDPDFKEKIKAYAIGKPVLVYCAVGGRSAKAAQCLQDLKVARVFNLAGGYQAWTLAGLPVKK